jgi:hypothetical protein
LRKDSGLLVVGLLLSLIGLAALALGMHGEGIAFSRYAGNASGSPKTSMVIGFCLIIGGTYFIFESGYVRRKK